MPISPEHLLSLAIVHESGSLSGAARSLGKTQPALSMQMRALGETVGQPVIVPTSRGVRLSDLGLELLPHAQAIARAIRATSKVVDKASRQESGRLRILTSTSVAVYLLPPVIASLKKAFPDVDVKIARRSSGNSIETLKRGHADLVIERVEVVPEPPIGFAVTRVFDDTTVLAVPPTHQLAQLTAIDIAQLQQIEIVAQEHPSRTRRLIERLYQESNIDFDPIIETIGVEAVKEAILQGFGVGFLPLVSIKREIARRELVSIHVNHPATQRAVIAMHAEDKLNSPLCRAFLEFLVPKTS